MSLKYLEKANLNLKAMKNSIYLLIGFMLLNFVNANNITEDKSKQATESSINVYCTPDLYNLTFKLSNEFGSLNPKLNIEVIKVPESSIAKTLSTEGNLGFISNEKYSGLNGEPFWKVIVGRDVIVPIISSKNPLLDEIYQQGISPEKFAQIFTNSEMQNWGALLENVQNIPIHYYMINDESINSEVANFLKLSKISINGIKVENEKELISAIQKDPYAIGFCKMINLIDSRNQSIVENIKLLPLDRNGNGQIDYIEKIYDDMNVLARGVWIGKYPKALFNDIYAVSYVKPTNEIEVEFLKWVLTDGQQFMNPTGYSELVFNERQRKLDILLYSDISTITSNDDYANLKSLIVILFSFIATVIIAKMIVQRTQKKTAVQNAASIYPLVFDENSIVIPKGLYFDKTHTWAFMEKDGIVRIGIDDFLQHITGTLTQIKMKNPGKKIKKGEQLLSIIHKGKQLHINAPISGTVKAQNETLLTNTAIINSSPYSDGWVYMIEPTNWLREIQFLIMDKKYKEWLKSEFSRLKDFLAITLKANTEEYAYSVLQDGGELKDGVLANLEPEVWEDFQTNFIDTSI